ncbi:MAG: hypothetical protein E7420_00605 [Ruminococcaceae bacterium]|nr:hypothetical protein [Oscillospiraceae bacterium]
MTLDEGKRKVYMLLDEYSSGGALTRDADIEAKMADFFDTAQKQAAEIKKIRRMHTIERKAGQTHYPMPADFLKLVRVWKGDMVTKTFAWKGKSIIIPESEKAPIEIEYFALPATIDPNTPGSYEFEVGEDAAKALPYFVASQQLITDLVMDYGALYAIYRNMLDSLLTSDYLGCELSNSLFRR